MSQDNVANNTRIAQNITAKQMVMLLEMIRIFTIGVNSIQDDRTTVTN